MCILIIIVFNNKKNFLLLFKDKPWITSGLQKSRSMKNHHRHYLEDEAHVSYNNYKNPLSTLVSRNKQNYFTKYFHNKERNKENFPTVIVEKKKLSPIRLIFQILLIIFLLKLRCQFDPPYGFSKNVSSREWEKPWFSVTFNIIISHIIPENFI